MRHGLFLSFSVLLGCSGPTARPDAESWPASPVVSATTLDDDTMPAVPAIEGDGEGEQPSVLFRCEEGRLGAYLVPGAAGDGEFVEERMVPISLDSAPSC